MRQVSNAVQRSAAHGREVSRCRDDGKDAHAPWSFSIACVTARVTSCPLSRVVMPLLQNCCKSGSDIRIT